MIRTTCNARDDARGKTRICATYNSSPSQDESDPDSENMTMEPCANRATPEASHKSQIHIEHAWTNLEFCRRCQHGSSQSFSTLEFDEFLKRNSHILRCSHRRLVIRQSSKFFEKQNSTVSLVSTPIKTMVTDVVIQENFT